MRRAVTDTHGPSTMGPQVTPASATFDEFGQRLHLLAGVLTEDPELADQLVLEAILAHPESCALSDLSAGIYFAWTEHRDVSTSIDAGDPAGTDLEQRIHALPADHRAALGLCRYGGHDYRRAAALMGLAPVRVARLLCEALRALGDGREWHVEPSSAA